MAATRTATMPPEPVVLANPLTAQTEAGPIAIICGGGSFPGAVAEAVERRGRRPVMLGIKGWADSNVVEARTHHWVALGQVGRLIRLARGEGCNEAVFIGSLLRPPLTKIRLDWRTIRSMPRLARAFQGGDDQLLKSVAAIIEHGGLRIIGLRDVAPEIMVQEGVLGGLEPLPRDRTDIERALKLIAALGPFDVGQAVVVANNYVLGIEAAEGTDNLLIRIAELRQKGRVATPAGVGVLVKAPKPGQDRRFDLPAIGPQTIANVARAGLAGLAVAAGSSIVAEPQQAIAAADHARIFFVGVRETVDE
jgi:DUF1009 family protein